MLSCFVFSWLMFDLVLGLLMLHWLIWDVAFCFNRFVLSLFLDRLRLWFLSRFVLYWFCFSSLMLRLLMRDNFMLCSFMLDCFVLSFGLNCLMGNYFVLGWFMFCSVFNSFMSFFMLNSLMLNLMFYFSLCRFNFSCCCCFLWFFSCLFLHLLLFFLWLGGLFVECLELFGDISDRWPILGMLLLLSSQLYEKSSGEYFFVEWIPNEVDSIYLGLEDNLEGSRIIFFDFDEVKIREWFFNIFFYGSEVAFDEVEGDVLDLVWEIFDALDKLILIGNCKLPFLFLSTFHHTNNIYYNQWIIFYFIILLSTLSPTHSTLASAKAPQPNIIIIWY